MKALLPAAAIAAILGGDLDAIGEIREQFDTMRRVAVDALMGYRIELRANPLNADPEDLAPLDHAAALMLALLRASEDGDGAYWRG